MRLTWRDGAATVLTALAVVYAIAFLQGGEVPVAPGVRGVTGTMLLLSFAACPLGGAQDAFSSRSTMAAMAIGLGCAALVIAVLAVILDSAVLLTALVGAVIGLWTLATLRHLVEGREQPVGRLHPTRT